MRECDHYRKSGETRFRVGVIEATCWGCGESFRFPINAIPPLWLQERLKGILTAVKIFQSVENPDGTSRLIPIESECCKYKHG